MTRIPTRLPGVLAATACVVLAMTACTGDTTPSSDEDATKETSATAPPTGGRATGPGTLLTNELAVPVASDPVRIRGVLGINPHGCFSIGEDQLVVLAPAFSTVTKRGRAIEVPQQGTFEVGEQVVVRAVVEDIAISVMGDGFKQNEIRDCLGHRDGQVASVLDIRPE
ncbi:hypothetical protein [Nocardioides alcanivorans]|uniref:hypothetical protein n=1 Tax=Nocardioides alcanivorans TaxID=2897352 RepID=UPI001F34760E|nr:hypothetical protein [Nocardioides alcanivorans]